LEEVEDYLSGIFREKGDDCTVTAQNVHLNIPWDYVDGRYLSTNISFSAPPSVVAPRLFPTQGSFCFGYFLFTLVFCTLFGYLTLFSLF